MIFKPKCWICGEVADSEEHMIKASDLRSIFGKFTVHAPIYRHSQDNPNETVQGPNSIKVKFSPSLCSNCNNARTQNHDKAWQRFSEVIRSNVPPLKSGSRIPLKEIFNERTETEILNVHLYFVKLFGCYAVEYSIPLPIHQFAFSILEETPQPNLELTFVHIPKKSTRYEIQVGKIDAMNAISSTGTRTVSAIWYYIVGSLGVLVSYKEIGRRRLNAYEGWHPDSINPSIKLR
ncbi:hypothetical protein [Undibacterium sp. Ji49W]|uniref:hypothetical protein n=1 Tax=Undibacterium sp. Ji49W TaxID=3413040 RepID=UPI003BF23E7B